MLLFFFQLSMAEKSHQKLLNMKSALENDSEIKSSSIFIDREECLQKRQNLHIINMSNGTILWMY